MPFGPIVGLTGITVENGGTIAVANAGTLNMSPTSLQATSSGNTATLLAFNQGIAVHGGGTVAASGITEIDYAGSGVTVSVVSGHSSAVTVNIPGGGSAGDLAYQSVAFQSSATVIDGGLSAFLSVDTYSASSMVKIAANILRDAVSAPAIAGVVDEASKNLTFQGGAYLGGGFNVLATSAGSYALLGEGNGSGSSFTNYVGVLPIDATIVFGGGAVTGFCVVTGATAHQPSPINEGLGDGPFRFFVAVGSGGSADILSFDAAIK